MFKKKKINNKPKSKIYANLVGILAIFIVFSIAYFTFSNISTFNFESGTNGTGVSKNFNFKSFFEGLRSVSSKVIEDGNNNSEENEKINVLLLGRGGGSHDAPNLTDTIIFASINKSSKTITMLSIPRDLYVSYGDEGREGKINQIYALERIRKGDDELGLKVLEDTIEDIVNQDIDYYFTIDFKGFISFIDSIGGVNITVPETLIDNEYPDGNWGYKTLIIKKGTWLFDGETALKYARSRHSTSDFDRSLRQHQILSAIKDRLNEGGFFAKLSKLKKFYDVFRKYVETDLSLVDMISIYKSIGDYGEYKIVSFNLNDSCFYGDPACQKGGFLYVPERDLFGGASVLLPNGAYKGNISDYEKVHKFTDLIFDRPQLFSENFQINVFNSTRIRGLAGDVAVELKRYGLNIPEKDSIGNIRDKTFTGSIIRYNSDIKDSLSVAFLEDVLGIDSDEITIEDDIYSKDLETKIEIIIGEDYKEVLENLGNNL